MTANSPSLLTSPLQNGYAMQDGDKNQQKPLTDLLYDGFLMLFLLKGHHSPRNASEFTEKVKNYLAEFEKNAKNFDIPAQDIHAAKYAFCAAVDEIILQSNFSIKEEWFLQPLQLTLFGDQLAGNNFFDKLEELRLEGIPRIQSLEVFHMCLLLGFQGKYFFDGKEKLSYLTARLGDEIAMMRGKRTGFAPYWSIPDKIMHALKKDIPIWAFAVGFAFLSLIAYLVISYFLGRDTNAMLAQYQNIVNLGPRAAHLTISLP